MTGRQSGQPAMGHGQRKAVFWMLIGASLTLACSLAHGQATRPFDEEQLKGSSTPAQLGSSGGAAAAAGSSGILDFSRVALALIVVVAVIFMLRGFARRFVRPVLSDGKPIKVLSRSVLSTRQQLLLLQVGKRLIVVGDSGANMNALCEINDPDEVATVIGQIRDDQPIAKSFGKFFSRAKEPFGDSVPPSDTEEGVPDPEVAEMSRDIGGLMEKVQLMRQQFKRS